MTTDKEIRLDILKLIYDKNEDVDQAITEAEKLYAFVKGDNESEAVKGRHVIEAAADIIVEETKGVEPGVKRTRKKKDTEVISADGYGTSETLVVEEGKGASLPVTLAEAAPVVEYKDLQSAVIALVRASPEGKTVALGILDQFGVATALELKPEQYAEALKMFTDALNG